MQELQEVQVRTLGSEDPLEGKRQPTPGFLPGKFHGQRSLAGYSPWDRRAGQTEAEPPGTHLCRYHTGMSRNLVMEETLMLLILLGYTLMGLGYKDAATVLDRKISVITQMMHWACQLWSQKQKRALKWSNRKDGRNLLQKSGGRFKGKGWVADSGRKWSVRPSAMPDPAPLCTGFSRQKCWAGLPCPSPVDSPDPRIGPRSSHCRQVLYRLSHRQDVKLSSGGTDGLNSHRNLEEVHLQGRLRAHNPETEELQICDPAPRHPQGKYHNMSTLQVSDTLGACNSWTKLEDRDRGSPPRGEFPYEVNRMQGGWRASLEEHMVNIQRLKETKYFKS